MRREADPSIAAVVLAAGGSSRFGKPKQLLEIGGQSLIRRIVEAVLETELSPVVVVVGAEAARVSDELDGLPVEIASNAQWREGIGSSIRAGITALEELSPTVSAALLLTCDQSRLTSRVLRRICDAFDRAPGRMVASEYEDTLGVPALFERSRFEELRELRGDRGAKVLLRRDPAAVCPVPWADGALDINDPEDYERLGSCGPRIPDL